LDRNIVIGYSSRYLDAVGQVSADLEIKIRGDDGILVVPEGDGTAKAPVIGYVPKIKEVVSILLGAVLEYIGLDQEVVLYAVIIESPGYGIEFIGKGPVNDQYAVLIRGALFPRKGAIDPIEGIGAVRNILDKKSIGHQAEGVDRNGSSLDGDVLAMKIGLGRRLGGGARRRA